MPAEYRTRNDAKIAVIAQAVSEGVLDFIGFDSRALSPNRNSIASSSMPIGNNKRKHETPNDSRASTPGSTSDGRHKRRKYFAEGSSNQSPQHMNHRSPQRSNHRRQPSSHNGNRQPWSGPTPPNPYSNLYTPQPHIPYQSPMSNIPPSYVPPYGYPTGSYPPNSNPYAMNTPGSYYGGPTMPIQHNTLPPPPATNPHAYQHNPTTSVMQPYPNGIASQIPPRNPVYMHPPMPPNVSYPQPSNATYSQPFQPYPSMPYPYPQQYGYPGPTPGAAQPTTAIPYVNKSSTPSQSISPAQASSQVVVKAALPPKPISATGPSERKPIVKRVAHRPKPSKPSGGRVTVAVEPTPQSSVTELYGTVLCIIFL